MAWDWQGQLAGVHSVIASATAAVAEEELSAVEVEETVQPPPPCGCSISLRARAVLERQRAAKTSSTAVEGSIGAGRGWGWRWWPPVHCLGRIFQLLRNCRHLHMNDSVQSKTGARPGHRGREKSYSSQHLGLRTPHSTTSQG